MMQFPNSSKEKNKIKEHASFGRHKASHASNTSPSIWQQNLKYPLINWSRSGGSLIEQANIADHEIQNKFANSEHNPEDGVPLITKLDKYSDEELVF